MLVIRDYSNNEYPLLAVKTINEELNGTHSIELKVPQQKNNNLDLKQIDKLWSIIYETVEYRIVYLKQITKGGSFYLDVRAIPLFYFDMDKQIIHENEDGHYTGVNAFNVVFQNSGYDYALVDSVNAIQIEGFGKGETRLEMFKRLIERFGLEFYIVGKMVYLKKLIGNDTNFMYKYKLNASNVSKSIDASNYFTHIKGFGNFEEGSENYLSDAKLKREFTSPLASVLGKYEGKPIVDGRIKDNATMDANLKRAVEESLEISIEGNLHDVRSIYAEAVPTIGDRVFLIDERINLEQEIRIHTLKRTYDVHDKLIDCEVTFGSQNIRDRYKSNLNSAAKDFTALMKGAIKLPTWSLDEIARGMITKIHASENELRYGDFGIQAIDKNNPNNVFGLNSQGWYISTDGGATARTIATAEGILAESIIGNHLIGLQLTSPGETGYFHVTGSDAEFVNTSNNRKVKISPDGVYGYNAGGDTRFQMDRQLVTSAALGTSNSNVYLATDTGFEARVVDRNQLPGSGHINDYTYRPMRALVYRFPDVPNAYFTLYNGGEFRFTGEQTGEGRVYQDVRANVFYGAGFRTTTTNAYIGADDELRVVNKGYLDGSAGSPIYRDLRANYVYNGAMITSTTNAHVGTDGELVVQNKGLSGIYRDIRCAKVIESSHEDRKKDISVWDKKVLPILKEELQLYSYRFKDDEDLPFSQIHHGIIIRNDSNENKFPAEWQNGDGYSHSEVTFWAMKALLELSEELDLLKEQINGE